MKGTYISGVLQDNVGSTNEALKLYESILPRVADTILTSSSAPEYRNWAERLLLHCCVLSNKIASLSNEKEYDLQSSGITLAPFRMWASFWESTSQYRGTAQANQSARIESAAQRQIWRLYDDTLSASLQGGQAYPMATHANPYVPETSNEHAPSARNSKLQQSIELRRVESIYEGLLLSDIPFPKADEINMEVEHWIDQVMANWRVVFGPAWSASDLGTGGKETVTRNVLAILYRAATRTFHSTRVLRHLFYLHSALAEFRLAAKAFDTYIELMSRAKERVGKSQDGDAGLDDDATALWATAAGIQMLCCYGRRKEVERAQDIAVTLEKWLKEVQTFSRSMVSAEDNPDDLMDEQKHMHQNIPHGAVAAAHRSLGVCRAHWSRLTYDVESRPELQAKAIASFQEALTSDLADRERGEIMYDLALILAETRDIDAAIDSVKTAISLSAGDAGEASQENQQDCSTSIQDHQRRISFRCWHLLSFLLSARQEFATAVASGDAAYDLCRHFMGSLEHYKPTERLALAERECILELKMSQMVLSQIYEGPGEAVNSSGELLGLYKELFTCGERSDEGAPGSAASIDKDISSPAQSLNGTVRSSRRSILGRSKETSIRPSRTGPSSQGASAGDGPAEVPPNPVISITSDEATYESKYQPPQHLTRQESKKLHKRQSRRSIVSDRHSRGVSPHKSSLANGAGELGQVLPLRVAQMKAPSLDPRRSGSSTGEGSVSADEVGLAVSRDSPSSQTATSSSEPAQAGRPHKAQSTQHKSQNVASQYSAPFQSASANLPIASFPTHSLPDPIYSSADLRRHALTLLARIWLLIAQLYRDAALPVDAQGALSEAFSQAQSIEAGVAATDSSAEALESPGWGKVKSVAEVWADVHAEQAALHLRLGNTNKAGEEFEKAIGWYPNHNAATVGLSSMLLDYYNKPSSTGETRAEPPVEELPSSQPILATLPTVTSRSSWSDQDITLKDEASPNLLSRLAARDRAYGLLSMLTKCGTGWDDSEAWSALARAYEESGQMEKAKEALWWVVELEESRPPRRWACIGGF
ncbi:MAG: hypothetical protein Q9183_003081 [Haloplaca sp. 2 TL-2023]